MATKPQTIDGYLAGLSPENRAALQKVRRAVHAAAPDAEECISYGMPAFRLNGKLIGFAVWERRSVGGRNVTFPARQYSVNGERRSFALLRPIEDVAAQTRIRDLIVEAYAELEASAV